MIWEKIIVLKVQSLKSADNMGNKLISPKSKILVN